MRPPIELYRPTILNIVAIITYCLATMFHIIAYATNNWASLVLDNVRWRMGLWQGCRELDDYCTTEVFEHKVFQTGSDWHTGAQVMMTLALIILVFLEFSLIGYACVKNLEKYRSHLVGITIALSLSAAFCHFLVLIMYGTEVDKIPESSVKASFGIVILNLFLEIVIPVFVYFDNHGTALICDRFIQGGRRDHHSNSNKTTASSARPTMSKTGLPKKDGGIRTIDSTISMNTSMTSLSEAETFRRFAFDEAPDPSLVSIGSINSINTRSTMYTNVSLSQRVSNESLV